MSANNNEHNLNCVVIDLGSPSADTLFPGMYMLRKSILVGAYLMNGAAIAASDSDYVVMELKNGSNVVAELDSRAAHENGIAQNTGEALNLDSDYTTIAAGSSLTANYNETDSGAAVALTNAKLILWFWQKETA